MGTPAIPRRLAFTAGAQQLINWGISFYMPGTFAGAIAADKGWSSPQIYLGLTLAMLIMAAVSRWSPGCWLALADDWWSPAEPY
jgi:hypothetical protein